MERIVFIHPHSASPNLFNSQFPIPNAQCPIPNSQCPMPNSQCPIPNSQCSITYLSEFIYGVIVVLDCLSFKMVPILSVTT
ncbi:MAG: hypothetical protein KME31_21490 [Tolypothrix carrinoi HA7290-LM1]|nr:hypothetical protein [Tolypothrix carrinoi HA7290-LM1]